MNKTKISEFMAFKFILPVIRMLASGESESGYSYLPGEKSDPDDVAWVYYYLEFAGIEEEILDCALISDETKAEMLELTRDVKKYMTSFSGVDVLPKKWYIINHELEAHRFSRQFFGKTRKLRLPEAFAVISSFLALCCLIEPIERNRDEISDLLLPQNLMIRLSDSQKAALKRVACDLKRDRKAMEKESLLRLNMIEELTGEAVAVRCPSKRACELKQMIESDGSMMVYYITEDEKRIVLLIVTDARLYWENQRPCRTVFGINAFGYEEKRDAPEDGAFLQVTVH